MNVLKLIDLIAAGPAMLATVGMHLAQHAAVLDCTGIAALLPDDLDQLLGALPLDWDFAEIGEVIDPATVTESFADQLGAWVDRRAGRVLQGTSGSSAEALPPPYVFGRLRQRLEDVVINELRGPVDGPDEIVDEPTVRGRYLVGMLAPKGQSGLPEAYDDDDLGGTDGEDGDVEAPPPKAATTMLPSSIGLTFAVAPEARFLRITARWGRYERGEVKDEAYRKADGSYRRVWKRSQMEGISPAIPLKTGRIEPSLAPCPEFPDVTVQGLIRDHGGQWIVTLFLVNGQQEPELRKDTAWLFQPELIVDSPDRAAIFQRRAPLRDEREGEERAIAMLYRNEVEFAVGHGVAVDWHRDPDRADRAAEVCTVVVPAYELPQTTPPTPDEFPALGDLTVDMLVLAQIPDGAFAQHLTPLALAYHAWLDEQAARVGSPTADLLPYLPAAHAGIDHCRRTLARIEAGIVLLDQDPNAAAAFRFANRAMGLQRIRSLYAAAIRRGEQTDVSAFEAPEFHTWRTFQLGFILLNLPGLTDLRHPDRAVPLDDPQANPAEAVADLLWFPTGGGKTEAYLGLAAYTMALRRLQGEVGGRSGHAGVAVLMRYTLRLLTLQQFQRAATLMCACEVIRREDPTRWGSEPFRIGLWVGQRSTPNWIEDAAEAIKQLKKNALTRNGTPYQLTNCPWCGTPIEPGRDLDAEPWEGGRGRLLTYCGTLLDHCPFNQRQSPDEGLPVMVVDEEIYARLPALLIATVDKFAQMPWNGRTAMLFGQVSGYCERHGFRSPEIEDADSHPANVRLRLPAARTREVPLLRPPDLIIQDELHLISGPLGTLVGLYETAVDQLASWEFDGIRVRPKVIASTATIRRADMQVHNLFMRRVNIFPPQGLDASDSFFARRRPPSDQYPGRRYLGICAPGIRHKTALIQTYIAFLAAAQQLYEKVGTADVDPWMTLVGYFNSLRELAAMRRAVDDTVNTRLRKMNQRGLVRRFLDPWSVQELTSRLSAADIPEILDRLEIVFDPAAKATAKAARTAGKTARRRYPIDILLATNMISVGVDVSRLGLMVVGGQPKSTAEYIQATSRVGRHYPGLVTTVYNWARPRDLSHYERFKHYHATFYQHVEALSVTPFAPRALDRGLSGLLVSLVRLEGLNFNANLAAAKVRSDSQIVRRAVDQIAARAELVNDPATGEAVRGALKLRVDTWMSTIAATVGARLGYRGQKDGSTVGLLRDADDDWELFTCLNSLRDVEQTVNLILEDDNLDGPSRPWTYKPETVDTATPVESEQ